MVNRLVVWLALGCGGDPLTRVLARDGDPEAGAAVFQEACASCHGPDGSGGDEGPNLRGDDDTREELAEKILYGWGAMEGFVDVLSVREVADVVAFVEVEVQTGSRP